MEFLLVAGMVVCGWVFLCVLSGERERRSHELNAELHREQVERERARHQEESNLRALMRASAAARTSRDAPASLDTAKN